MATFKSEEFSEVSEMEHLPSQRQQEINNYNILKCRLSNIKGQLFTLHRKLKAPMSTISMHRLRCRF